jgi:uroporphyrin-III C-methyltransferase
MLKLMTASYQSPCKIFQLRDARTGEAQNFERCTMKLSDKLQGSCTLVGAGPGDPELLTLKALRAIESATVLLIDDLVSEPIAALAPANARVIQVGKRGGCPSTPQAFIEKLMITEVRKGERVVRLKGGDPFVFGRGGEEVESLREAGIDVQVVNGITAGLAAVTSLGLPLTHRDHAHGVMFLTGHARSGGDTDWRALSCLAQSQQLTLVIYMGVRSAGQIAQELLYGLPAQTAVAVVQNVSLPEQRHIATTLEDMAQDMARHRMGSPAVIVVGEVMASLALAQAHPHKQLQTA